MKRSVMLSVLGLGLAAAATTAYGQGQIVIGNYRGAYNPVVWDASVPDADGRVSSSEGVNLTLWYGEGSLLENQLTTSVALPWNSFAAGNGFIGYYGDLLVNLPDFQSGDVYTFQVRASGSSVYGPVVESLSRSILWTESANIGFVGGTPPGPPGTSANSIGLTVVVPEPSTFALAGIGAAAMLIFRRRNQ
jgi:hypothetical protein